MTTPQQSKREKRVDRKMYACSHLFLILLFFILSPQVYAAKSQCYGTTANGRIHNAVKLPSDGKNFTSYSWLGEKLGRTYVHSMVKAILIDAWQKLEKKHPQKKFKYAETGYQQGGKFKPHKTHQNGLSVDFMVPVINKSGKSVYLPTNALNKWGYDIEFSKKGRFEEYQIDFEAMAAHIVSLHKASRNQGVDIWRVIFAPELQHYLFETPYGDYIRKNIHLSKKRAWVRHDEHYHVDFKVPCRPLKSK